MNTIFNDDLPELRASEVSEPRDLEAELFNKRSIKDMVANFEKELGIAPQKKNKTIKRISDIFSPGKGEDGDRLNKILNEDDKYRIVMWKDTWTVHGEYRVFLIYEEVIDDKKDKRKTTNE